jgi:hypothetical protein
MWQRGRIWRWRRYVPSVDFQRTTRRYLYENLKSYMEYDLLVIHPSNPHLTFLHCSCTVNRPQSWNTNCVCHQRTGDCRYGRQTVETNRAYSSTIFLHVYIRAGEKLVAISAVPISLLRPLRTSILARATAPLGIDPNPSEETESLVTPFGSIHAEPKVTDPCQNQVAYWRNVTSCWAADSETP